MNPELETESRNSSQTSSLYLFEDSRARTWSPLTSTRPAGELLFGCNSIRERVEEALGRPCAGHLTGPELEGFDGEGGPVAFTREEVPTDRGRILLSSRAILDPEQEVEWPGNVSLILEGEVVGWSLPPGADLPPPEMLAEPSRHGSSEKSIHLKGSLIEHPWQLIAGNRARIAEDLHHRFRVETSHEDFWIVIGDETLSVDPDATVEPGVVLDLSAGPIRLERGVKVLGPARLTGPLYIAHDTVILGGSVSGSSIGPWCKVRGEISDSIIQGYSNKAHDGYLGHAHLGRWVNLGAGTNNSDLENNYGSVRMWTSEGEHDTGLTKLGCFLGDHVKTAIGTLLNTGSVIETGAMISGSAMPAKHLNAFSWGGSNDTPYDVERFLKTARIVMARRSQELSADAEAILRRIWNRQWGGE